MPGARPQTGFEGAGLNRSAPEPRDQPRSETLRPIPAGVLVPNRGVKRLLFSEGKLFDDETHEVSRGRARWCHPMVPTIQDVPEPGHAGE